MKHKSLFAALAFLALPLALTAQLGDLSAPHAPKSYIAYTALPQAIPAGRPATLELRFRVLPGYHVNSHTPTQSYLIPTALTFTPAPGVKPGEPAYPSGQPYSFAFDPKDKLSVYAGDFLVKLPVIAAPGDHTIKASLRYQACNNASCFPPRNLDIAIPFTAK